MNKRLFAHSRKSFAVCGLLLVLSGQRLLMAEPTAANAAAFDLYTKTVESRLAQQHRSTTGFLAYSTPGPRARDTRATDPGLTAAHLRRGELIVERVEERTDASADFTGTLLHHWRGTAFAPGATAADFERLLRDFNSYPQRFSPQVLQARAVPQDGHRILAPIQVQVRVRQRHILTVVLDTTYDVAFGQLDPRRRYSISRSTRIDEVAAPDTGVERTLSASEEHGFLWRLNTYWSYEERDGGLYLQIESVSLTRSIPNGLGWALRPYVDSIPRESLEFTLRSACNAIRK